MGRDVSIAISARDNYSQTITNMRNANQGFNKDLDGMTKRLNALNATKASIKVETTQMQKELQAARRQFLQTGDAADEMAYRMAEADYDDAQRNLRLVSQNAREAEKDLNNLTDAVMRAENRAGGSGGGDGVLASLAKAGLGKMVGDSLAGAANVMIGSAFGDNMGSAISNTLSKAFTGAAMGSIAGLPGAAIGAGVGLVSGLIDAGGAQVQRYDDVFVSEVQARLSDVEAGLGGMLEAGSALSQEWATGLLAFESLLPGRSETFMEELRRMDAENPFDMAGLMTQSKLLMTSGVDEETTKRALGGIGNAAAITGMSTQDMEQIAQTIGYMGNLSNITKRQTDIFTMRGVPIMEYLAAARGVTVAEAYEAMSDGKISGRDAQQIVIDGMERDPRYAGAAEALMNTMAGAQSALNSQYEMVQRSMGDAHDEIALAATKKEMDLLEGGLTDALSEAHAMAGRGMAEREALERQYLLDAQAAVFGGGEIGGLYQDNAEDAARLEDLRARYENAKKEEDNIAAEGILKEVEVLADIAFKASPEMLTLQDSQTTLAENTQEILSTHSDYVEKSLAYQDQISKGMASLAYLGFDSKGKVGWTLKRPDDAGVNTILGDANRYSDALGLTGNDPMASAYGGKPAPPPGNAWGIPYVPRDNYMTRLHEGEKVLTAQEARSQGAGGPPSITINAPGMVIREEADLYRLAQELALELQKAQQVS